MKYNFCKGLVNLIDGLAIYAEMEIYKSNGINTGNEPIILPVHVKFPIGYPSGNVIEPDEYINKISGSSELEILIQNSSFIHGN